MKNWVFLLVFTAIAGSGFSQKEAFYPENWRPDSVSTKRVKIVGITGGTFYVASMASLYSTWYSQHSTGSFHTFDDLHEWEGMDKMGHVATTYTVSRFGYEALNWSGVNNTKSTLYGAGYAFLYQTTIEVFDGFSEGWGFSWGDVAANTLGAGVFASQQLLWKEQRITLKYSYSPSEYAQYRPNLLGSSWNEKMLKDYNGQTYWLSGNISSFMKPATKFPKWINFAVGYGAGGMLGGHENPTEVDGQPVPHFDRYRQMYFSMDVDFTRIKTRSKFLKTTFIVLSFVKIPFPTLEINSKGETVFHGIMF